MGKMIVFELVLIFVTITMPLKSKAQQPLPKTAALNITGTVHKSSLLLQPLNWKIARLQRYHEAMKTAVDTKLTARVNQQLDKEARRFGLWRGFRMKPFVSPLFLINGTVCRVVNFQPICTTLSTTNLMGGPSGGGSSGGSGGGGASRPSGGGGGGSSGGGSGGGGSSGGSGGSGGGSSGGGSGGGGSGGGGNRPASSGASGGNGRQQMTGGLAQASGGSFAQYLNPSRQNNLDEASDMDAAASDKSSVGFKSSLSHSTAPISKLTQVDPNRNPLLIPVGAIVHRKVINLFPRRKTNHKTAIIQESIERKISSHK